MADVNVAISQEELLKLVASRAQEITQSAQRGDDLGKIASQCADLARMAENLVGKE